ncbi:class I SAM-dependent methyltransferase [Magnetospirillum sp. UT-4]|uniref:class I SAM-dependent methyltransferase n=1 Tax=Magnetospirillum sp. UT-4 TaxID=2681467 RepID=UPI00137F1624|nr:class I SAM-dependent methyltransferase [Magnetospirillum sp. UT-4]CAA7618288.1 conserved hypothetical protein [Magnetospirillum sp. UT-4]
MTDADQLISHARSEMASSRFASACALLERAAALDPDHPGLLAARAAACRRDARYAECIALVAAAGAAAGVQPLYERAMSLAHLGQAEAALAGFDAVLERDPNRAAAWFGSFGPALEVAGMDSALARLRRAAACPGANGKYWGVLAATLRLAGRADEAAAVHARALARHPRRRAMWDGVAAIAADLAPACRLFGLSAPLLRHALDAATVPGLVLEFGVRRGTSLTHLAEAAGQTVHGFDSFQGLPADWGGETAGVLTTGTELPVVPANARLHPGWFEDSLPDFLADHPGPVRLVNIDSDIHASARTVLWRLADRLVPGSVVVFDEFIGNRTWAADEFRAWSEFTEAFGVRATVFALSTATKQVAMAIAHSP